MTVFNQYASFYDSLYSNKDYQAESAYIEKLLNQYAASVNSILDLGCGTGKHAISLATKGYQVSGVDISENMLSFAEQHKAKLSEDIQSNLTFINADIGNIELNEKYDAVTSLFHVASYQVADDDIKAFFQTIARHLKKNGVLCFDCWYGPGVLADPPEKREKTVVVNGDSYQRVATPVFQPEINSVTVNYSISNEQTGDSFNESHQMRYFFKNELESYLADCGFELIDLLQPMTELPVDDISWTAMVVAINKNKSNNKLCE